jgi:Na+-translocating ferredoxin:NAD+ oxidoreductase subunit C
MGLATFNKGGIHPPDKKTLAADNQIIPSKAPKIVVIPLSQHIGAPCNPAVSIGQEVKKG